jgi:hypothetical protein
MQVSNKYIINAQTVQPFTSVQRIFNMKEANSSGNCIGGQGCTVNGPVTETSSRPLRNITEIDPNKQKISIVESDGSIELVSDRANVLNNEFAGRVAQNPNSSTHDYTYNSYADFRAPMFNQWTKIHDDNCNEENRLRIGSKPMKYFVNQYNSPQIVPFMQYTTVGGQKQYDVRNDYERAIPTRLNPIYDVAVLPYNTTPFLGNANENRANADTGSYLRWGSDLKAMKSQKSNTEVDYNRWAPNVDPQTVQNAGQFGMKMQQATPGGEFYDYSEQNNIIFMNSAVPYFGVSSRNLLHNIVSLSGC